MVLVIKFGIFYFFAVYKGQLALSRDYMTC